MFSFEPSLESVLARCELLGEGCGSNSRDHAERQLRAEAEFAWAVAVVARNESGN